MSSDEDDDEWEREQIARGTQSKRQLNQDRHLRTAGGSIDVNMAKKRIYDDMQRIQDNMESVRWRMGSTTLELSKSKKAIESIQDDIKKLESVNPLFEQIASLEDGQQALDFFERNKSVISNLPHDQKELLTNMADQAKEMQQKMEVDQ